MSRIAAVSPSDTGYTVMVMVRAEMLELSST